MRKKDKKEISIIRSSAAEYLTFITATGESDNLRDILFYYDIWRWLLCRMHKIALNFIQNTNLLATSPRLLSSWCRGLEKAINFKPCLVLPAPVKLLLWPM